MTPCLWSSQRLATLCRSMIWHDPSVSGLRPFARFPWHDRGKDCYRVHHRAGPHCVSAVPPMAQDKIICDYMALILLPHSAIPLFVAMRVYFTGNITTTICSHVRLDAKKRILYSHRKYGFTFRASDPNLKHFPFDIQSLDIKMYAPAPAPLLLSSLSCSFFLSFYLSPFASFRFVQG